MVILLKKSTLSIHSESMFNPFFSNIQQSTVKSDGSTPTHTSFYVTTNSHSYDHKLLLYLYWNINKWNFNKRET